VEEVYSNKANFRIDSLNYANMKCHRKRIGEEAWIILTMTTKTVILANYEHNHFQSKVREIWLLELLHLHSN